MTTGRIRFRDPSGSLRSGRLDGDHVHTGGLRFARSAVQLLPPVAPSKIVCVGRNYRAHAEERKEDVPDRPLLFLKPPNTVAGPGDVIPLPANRAPIEHEVELGVVLGRECRRVNQAEAMDYVEGFTIVNDVSNRQDQDREVNWVRGKAFDGSCPLGPVVVSPDKVPDDARLESRVNGEHRQQGSRDQMIFSIPELIEEITRYMTLHPGDVIATGTPEGVGPLVDGDTVTLTIEGIGTLEHSVTREPRDVDE